MKRVSDKVFSDVSEVNSIVRIPGWYFCHYCDEYIIRATQCVKVELVANGQMKHTRFIHLECWLPYQDARNRKRIKPMSNKDTKPLNPDDVPAIGEVVETTKQWDYTHAEVLNVEMIILKAEPIETMYGEAFLCDCIIERDPVKVMMGAVVLVSTLERIQDKLPVKATIVKVGQFYNFA